MTSRPPLDGKQRQPQRPLGVSQRQPAPPPQRALKTSGYLPHDLGDGTSRNGSLRRGGSRLRLELPIELSGEPFANPPPNPNLAVREYRIAPTSENLALLMRDAPPVRKQPVPPKTCPSIYLPYLRKMGMADGDGFDPLSTHNPSRVLHGGMSMLDLPSEPPRTAYPVPDRRQRFALNVPDLLKNPPAPAPPPKKDNRPKPYVVEVPGLAPRFVGRAAFEGSGSALPGGKGAGGLGRSAPAPASNAAPAPVCADFFPWNGDSAEDQFSHKVITEGHYERQPPYHLHDSVTAKGHMLPALKQNRGGLDGLSSVYSNVLRNRRENGRVVAPPSFKPPPRVTLTDTKREVWLKDLANPDVPLRRLSRTIPHGVRGRALLDQCLNKRFSIDRALWLTKCVGANEIRAVKRKTTSAPLSFGGEAKWIRDWTLCVEQFVESTLSTVETPGWKRRVEYALRLARHLCANGLLDTSHYLEWLVAGMETSSAAKLPFWLILTRTHHADIVARRKYGVRLVLAVLNHTATVLSSPDRQPSHQKLETELTGAISKLFALSPESFISPSTWPKQKAIVHSSLPLAPGDLGLQAAFERLDFRNERLSANCVRSQPAVRAVLVRLLDTTLYSAVPPDLSARCLAVTRDVGILTRVILEWATSLHRPGMAKVYVAANLFKSWAADPHGLNVTDTILHFLGLESIVEEARKELVFRLVAELVRLKQFSMRSYVRWLMARGGLTQTSEVEPDGPCLTRLLVELPVDKGHFSTLRAHILQRVSYPVADQDREINNAVEITKSLLQTHPEPSRDSRQSARLMSYEKFIKRLPKASFQVKLRVASWIRKAFVEDQQAEGLNNLSDATFCKARAILEACQDFSVLADVLKTATCARSADVLASCTDTVAMNHSTLDAVGAVKPLFEKLLARGFSLTVTEDNAPSYRRFLGSLATLAPRVPDPENERLAAELAPKIALWDRGQAIDACSPISDNNPEPDGLSVNCIERLLASGNTIDYPTMERLFEGVITFMEVNPCGDRENKSLRRSVGYLSRLRIVNPQSFDRRMTKFLQFQHNTQTNLVNTLVVYPLMISFGCLSLSLILSTLYGDASMAAKTQVLPPRHQRMLQLVLEPLSERCQALMSADEVYRFRVAQTLAPKTNPAGLTLLIRMALAEFASSPESEQSSLPLGDIGLMAAMRAVLMDLTVADSNLVARTLVNSRIDNVASVSRFIEAHMERILLPTKSAVKISFEQVLQMANELTMPFCQIKLMASLASPDQSRDGARVADPGQRLQSQLDLFARAMDKAIDDGNMTWTGMLGCLNPEIAQHLKNKAQARFLGLLPSPSRPQQQQQQQQQPQGAANLPARQPSLRESLMMSESLLAVVDIIIRGGSMGRPPQLVPAMVERLDEIWEILATPAIHGPDVQEAVRQCWLPQLLTFLTLHTATFDTSKASIEVRAHAVLGLAGIAIELVNASHGEGLTDVSAGASSPMPGSDFGGESLAAAAAAAAASLAQRSMDLAFVLVDNLPGDAVRDGAAPLMEAVPDDRLRYLFSRETDVEAHFLAPDHPEPEANGAAETDQAKMARPFSPRRWELLNEQLPTVGENDGSLDLMWLGAFKMV